MVTEWLPLPIFKLSDPTSSGMSALDAPLSHPPQLVELNDHPDATQLSQPVQKVVAGLRRLCLTDRLGHEAASLARLS